MRLYTGQTRSRALVAELTARGWGECTLPAELPPRRPLWFFDNGAFGAWRHGTPWDERGYLAAVEAIGRGQVRRWDRRARRDVHHAIPAPAFVVVPDRVAAGNASLVLSMSWVARLRGLGPLALAVQDGMDGAAVEDVLGDFGVLFVGGSPAWKWQTAGAWCRLARRHGKACHVARAGTARKVMRAKALGADSVDSCVPLWSTQNLDAFADGAGTMVQLALVE